MFDLSHLAFTAISDIKVKSRVFERLPKFFIRESYFYLLIRIIAVGYEARKAGVTRQMRGDEAKSKCPDIHLVHVPENRGKADLTQFRDAGAEVIDVLSDFSDCLERASIDEAYLDLTNTVQRSVDYC